MDSVFFSFFEFCLSFGYCDGFPMSFVIKVKKVSCKSIHSGSTSDYFPYTYTFLFSKSGNCVDNHSSSNSPHTQSQGKIVKQYYFVHVFYYRPNFNSCQKT